MHGLNLLISRHSQLLVLRVLYHAKTPVSGREVERRTGLSNRATMLALESLTDIAAIHKEESPPSYLYTFNRNHYFAKAMRAAFDAEDQFWIELGKTVRRNVQPRPLAAVATGPLARDESQVDGRVELILLFSSGRNRIRAFKAMESLAEVAWDRYAVTLDPVLLDINNMNQEENDPLWRRVEREGILLFGSLP